MHIDYLTNITKPTNWDQDSSPIVAIDRNNIQWCLSEESCHEWATRKADSSCSRDWQFDGQKDWNQVRLSSSPQHNPVGVVDH